MFLDCQRTADEGVPLTLKDLEIGQSCIVEHVGGEGSLRQHFLDMGIIPGARVTLVKYAPMGDPMELRIHSYELTLRLADAEQIDVRPLTAEDEEPHATGTRRPRRSTCRIPSTARRASSTASEPASPCPTMLR